MSTFHLTLWQPTRIPATLCRPFPVKRRSSLPTGASGAATGCLYGYGATIPSGKVAISLTVKTLASGLSDKLQPGDIIRIYHFLDTAAEVLELRFVKVLSVTDSDGINVDNAKEPTEDEEKQQSATITVLASPEQAKIITGLENDGVAHVALISRNNDKLADELLAEQDKTLQEIYFPETLIEEEAADAENSDAESEPQETETAESAQSTNETAPSAE